jgi:hypothetical protein
MKKNILFLLISIASLSVQAQKEAYNWRFGYNAGLTWNTTQDFTGTGFSGTAALSSKKLTGIPTSVTGSALSSGEGCFTLSDINGNLKFYSDGMKVYTANNTVMPNGSGLNGGSSSTQSGILFPYPGSATKYVAVSINQQSISGVYYSVIDMTLNGGLGDITADKNVPFTGGLGTISENVTSIKIPNSDDYWVIAIGKGIPTRLNVWRFSPTGISGAVVTSTFPTGPNFDTNGGASCGYLKITPDGKHFVWAAWQDRKAFVGDFDITTGRFTNIRPIAEGYSAGSEPYGVEFSPDQTLVYIEASGYIYVYKASELFANATPSTATKKVISNPTGVTAIQLAPDGRIYGCSGSSNMIVIENPNDFANLAIYKLSNLITYGGNAIGLPSFPANYFEIKPSAKKFACTGYDYKFTAKIDMSAGVNAPIKLSLNYGDGNTGTIPLIGGQTDYNIAHTYVTAGTYTVTITPVKSDNSTLTPSTITADVIDCTIRTNRMIRVDLQNLNTAPSVQP